MPSREDRIIKLTIVCIDLPPHDWGGHLEIWLGIQRGKEVIQQVKLPAQTIHFEAELRVAADASEATPNFLGQYAQGTVQDRFVYLCWGSPHDDKWVGFRRAKLRLTGLTWESLESGRLLATVRCTDAKGSPVCATLRGDHITWSAII